tara:strand:- start:358 stop:519 length:162 start_codon:yes stop_codon:yes gene_type:complete
LHETDSNITREDLLMSNLNNETILENYYEEGIDMGMTQEEAENYAYEQFEQRG